MKSEIILKDFKCHPQYERVYNDRKGVVRWCKNYLEKTSSHIYLSLYNYKESGFRSSSIEFTKDTTFCDNNLLVYVNGDTTLVYHVLNDEVFEALKAAYNQIKDK